MSVLTFLQTFYSAAFINPDDENEHLTLTKDWWKSLAIAIPLTLFTIMVWLFFVWMDLTDRWPKLRQRYSEQVERIKFWTTKSRLRLLHGGQQIP